jgi:hypothetical protein
MRVYETHPVAVEAFPTMVREMRRWFFLRARKGFHSIWDFAG